MASRDIITTLSLLSQREREVLARKCGGLDYKTIGQQLHIAIPTVKADMGRVYVKLRLDQLTQAERLRMLFEVFCPLLRTVELPQGLPETEEQEPPPLQLVVLNMVEDDERTLVPYTPHYPAYAPSQSEIITARPVRQPKPLRWMVFGVILGVLVMVGIYLALPRTSTEVETQPQPLLQTIVVTQIAEVTVVVTPTPAPEQPTPQPPQETVVTQQVTVVVVVTSTPEPPTPEPTATPTSALALPFQDNFDGALQPGWSVLSGQPVFVNSQLRVAGGELTLQIGDASFGGNYTVSFYDEYCFPQLTVVLAQRVRFSFGAYNSFSWQGFQDNGWVTLPGGANPQCPGTLQIKVAGNSYTVISQGAVILEGTYGEPAYGPLTLTIAEGRILDNFTLTSP